MSDELKNEKLIEKAELFMAIKNYEMEERQKWDKGTDLIATQPNSDDKILLRIITEPKSTTGIVGVDAVREMSETMESEDYDTGVLISKKFSQSAWDEMIQEGIQTVSEKYMPAFKPQRYYFAIQEYIDDLCQTKCNITPEKVSDCNGLSDKDYSCKVRLISDNASYHFEQGWTNLLQEDFEQLIALHKASQLYYGADGGSEAQRRFFDALKYIECDVKTLPLRRYGEGVPFEKGIDVMLVAS